LRTLVRVLLICGGCLVILLPAWLPSRPSAPVRSGTIELLQALFLAAASAIVIGASSHAGPNRPVCQVIALGLVAGFVGEIEDFLSGFLGVKFPETWIIATILLVALFKIFRHRRVMLHFFGTMGNHAGTGFIGAALLILYIFNKLFGSSRFWRAALGVENYSPDVPKICKSYLELFGCYLIFIGMIGLAITLARRREP
jgi:hypothetical protein